MNDIEEELKVCLNSSLSLYIASKDALINQMSVYAKYCMQHNSKTTNSSINEISNLVENDYTMINELKERILASNAVLQTKTENLCFSTECTNSIDNKNEIKTEDSKEQRVHVDLSPKETKIIDESSIDFQFSDSSKVYSIPLSVLNQYPRSLFYMLYKDHIYLSLDGPIQINNDSQYIEDIIRYMKGELFDIHSYPESIQYKLLDDISYYELPFEDETLNKDEYLTTGKIRLFLEEPLILLGNESLPQFVSYLQENNILEEFAEDNIMTMKWNSLTNHYCIYMNTKYPEYIKYILNISTSSVSQIDTEVFLEDLDINHIKLPSYFYTQLYFHGHSSLLELDYICDLLEWAGENTQWNLLFRASDHNFSAKSFHDICDNHENLLVLVKTTIHSHDCIFGGYTRIGWNTSKSKIINSEYDELEENMNKRCKKDIDDSIELYKEISNRSIIHKDSLKQNNSNIIIEEEEEEEKEETSSKSIEDTIQITNDNTIEIFNVEKDDEEDIIDNNNDINNDNNKELDSSTYCLKDSDAYVFTLDNIYGQPATQYNSQHIHDYSIFYSSSLGPCFSSSFYISDHCNDNINSFIAAPTFDSLDTFQIDHSLGSSIFVGTNQPDQINLFKVKEYEVFQKI
ncbi:hypothetical protein WA158_004489 [Blastocystis sp. Blastoise]